MQASGAVARTVAFPFLPDNLGRVVGGLVPQVRSAEQQPGYHLGVRNAECLDRL